MVLGFSREFLLFDLFSRQTGSLSAAIKPATRETMSEPEFSFGRGRNQIKLKGNEAIRAGGVAIRFLLFSKGIAIVLGTGAVSFLVGAFVRWLFS
jgi:hypothetical protein